jgi:hypothetical protein
MSNITREQAIAAMVEFYPQARQQLADSGAFGKVLDNKARKLSLKLANITVPEGLTIAWATPDDWGKNGYRSPGRPFSMEGGKRVNVYLDADSLIRAEKLGSGNVSEGIRLALVKTHA